MMNKDDLIKSFDIIEPDPYMKTRLKAKSIPKKTHSGAWGKIAAGVLALSLVLAIMFGLYPSSPTVAPTTEGQTETEQQNVRQISPFIMVAGAVESENEAGRSEYKSLKLNDTFPFAYKISFTDVRGMSDDERNAIVRKAEEKMNLSVAGGGSDNFEYGIACVRSFENIIFTEALTNSIKLDLPDGKELKSINVQNSSEWGYVEYYDGKLIEIEINKGNNMPIPHGNNITITADQYHQESGGFHWKNSYKLDNAINDNPDILLSTFKDTITFTVEYIDGTKEVGVIDVTFDDDGNGTFTLKEYREG